MTRRRRQKKVEKPQVLECSCAYRADVTTTTGSPSIPSRPPLDSGWHWLQKHVVPLLAALIAVFAASGTWHGGETTVNAAHVTAAATLSAAQTARHDTDIQVLATTTCKGDPLYLPCKIAASDLH